MIRDCISELFLCEREEGIECLCVLLTTVGKEFDRNSGKVCSLWLIVLSMCRSKLPEQYNVVLKIPREPKILSSVDSRQFRFQFGYKSGGT